MPALGPATNSRTHFGEGDVELHDLTLLSLALWLILGQIALGIVNILALAPLSLQMAHLFVANLLWVSLVWLWLLVRGAATRSGRVLPAS